MQLLQHSLLGLILGGKKFSITAFTGVLPAFGLHQNDSAAVSSYIVRADNTTANLALSSQRSQLREATHVVISQEIGCAFGVIVSAWPNCFSCVLARASNDSGRLHINPQWPRHVMSLLTTRLYVKREKI